MSEELKPCPFCGKWITLVSTSASAEWEEEFPDDPFPHSESHAIVCDVNKDGCGGSSGYAASLEIATSRWNRRTP